MHVVSSLRNTLSNRAVVWKTVIPMIPFFDRAKPNANVSISERISGIKMADADAYAHQYFLC